LLCRRTITGWAVRLICCAPLLLAGCAREVGPLFPVQGIVTLNGKPLSNGEVVFVPVEEDARGPTLRGTIQSDGSYTLRTGNKAGAPAGQYRVAVVVEDTKTLPEPLNLDYSSTAKTPLRIDVTEGKPAGGYDIKLSPVPRSN
jgi:hypothetical protein